MQIAIHRLPDVVAKTGRRRSTVYSDIKAGTFPPPIKVGRRAVGWPAHEVDEILRARVSGQGEEQVRMLVCRLLAARGAQ